MTLLTEICDFTNPLEDGSPSLWDQLLAGPTPTGLASNGKPKSKLPTDAGTLSLITEVELATRARGRRVPGELRRIERLGHNDQVEAMWAKDVRRWVNEARAVLNLIPNRISLPRGTRCIECDEGWIVEVDKDGGEVMQPAVVLLWVEPHRDRIDKVVCLSCHVEWPASVLMDMAGA